jgi:glutamate 5-kinase
MTSAGLAGMRRFVVKIGTSVLTDQAGRLSPERLHDLVEQVTAAAGEGRQPVVVSSGAIACGMAKLGLLRRPTALAQLQACAAIGQGELMQHYARMFERHGLLTAQVLLTQEDLADRARFRNAQQTLLTLLHHRVVPIVNENDTVAVEEITFGDNDRLAALVACAIAAQLLVILSDVDGLLHNGRTLERVETLPPAAPPEEEPVAELPAATVRLWRPRGELTKGGMSSKLEAARIVGHSGIPMVIANGTRAQALTALLAGRPTGTLFVPPRERLTSRKWWLAFALRTPKGAVVIDPGAARAVLEQGKSLLATGVREIRGRFSPGAFVAVLNDAGEEVARGICALSSSELARVRGLRSAEAARVLGQPKMPEVIHRDDLVLARDLHADTGRRAAA